MNWIDPDHQRNLWGNVRDLQRSDLWYVDFFGALLEINAVLKDEPQVALLPQHAQSVVLPDLNKIRVEQVRRDSIPYPMPSWDECLEPIIATFWLESISPNPVIVLLERWSSLVRAGRGKRMFSADHAASGEDAFATALVLDKNYSISFRFYIYIYMLQGSISIVQGSEREQIVVKKIRDLSAAPEMGGYICSTAYAISKLGSELSNDYCKIEQVKIWKARVWLSSYKISELDYKANGLVTVTATFQPDFIQLESSQ